MKKKTTKRILWFLLTLFLIGNIITYNHAYRFTHFSENQKPKTQKPESLSFSEKLSALFFGINIPKPVNKTTPERVYSTIELKSRETLESWLIPAPSSNGIVLMFHGYSSSKSGLLRYAEEFYNLGYTTMLVDFMGSGNSSGNVTTVGFKEGYDVKVAFDHIKQQYPDKEIILFGVSMGAAAILKSVHTYDITPDKIILECPFGTMLATAKKRFEAMNVPSFPFAELLLFYGGFQNGFNAFTHKPIEYAKKIQMPVLLMYGAKDARVSRKETDDIFNNFPGEKQLVVFKNSAHEIYLNDHAEDWKQAVSAFLHD